MREINCQLGKRFVIISRKKRREFFSNRYRFIWIDNAYVKDEALLKIKIFNSEQIIFKAI